MGMSLDPSSWAGDIQNSSAIITNLAKNLEPIDRLLTGAAYLIGVSFAFKAIYSLKVYGEARTMMSTQTSMKEPVMYLMVAAIFVYFPSAVELVLNSSFGYKSVLAYAPISSGNASLNTLFGANSAVGRPLTMLIQTIGLIAFIRGWILIARSASQGQPPGGTGKGMMHILGGIAAMNIVGTLQIIDNSLYGTN